MTFIELIRDWVDNEYKGELKVQSLSSEGIGQIIKPFVKERIEFIIAYIAAEQVIFGPNWGNATWIAAGDPELFDKMRLHIEASGYKQHTGYTPGKENFQTML